MVKTSAFLEYANHVGRVKKINDQQKKIWEAGKTWPNMSEAERAPWKQLAKGKRDAAGPKPLPVAQTADERRAQSARDKAAAAKQKKQREFNDWKLYQMSDRTLADAQLYQPQDYELMPCDGAGTLSCPHPDGYHEWIEAEEKARKDKEEKEKALKDEKEKADSVRGM